MKIDTILNKLTILLNSLQTNLIKKNKWFVNHKTQAIASVVLYSITLQFFIFLFIFILIVYCRLSEILVNRTANNDEFLYLSQMLNDENKSKKIIMCVFIAIIINVSQINCML